jgi:hypothetical protein
MMAGIIPMSKPRAAASSSKDLGSGWKLMVLKKAAQANTKINRTSSLTRTPAKRELVTSARALYIIFV